MLIIGYLAPSLCALTRITHVVAQRWNCYCSTRAEFCFMKRRMHYPYNSSKQRSTIHNRCHIFGYELACKSKQQQIIGIDKHLRSHICWNRYADTEHQLVSSVSQEIWAWFEIIFVKLHICWALSLSIYIYIYRAATCLDYIIWYALYKGWNQAIQTG